MNATGSVFAAVNRAGFPCSAHASAKSVKNLSPNFDLAPFGLPAGLPLTPLANGIPRCFGAVSSAAGSPSPSPSRGSIMGKSRAQSHDQDHQPLPVPFVIALGYYTTNA